MIEDGQVTASGTGAVAVGTGNSGTIHTHINFAGRPEVSWPYRVGVVPPVVAGYLPRTDSALSPERVLAHRFGEGSTLLLSGMGGVGKTQLAATYAHQLWKAGGVDLLVWLSATGRDGVLTAYAQAGADVAHPAPREEVEQVAQRFLAWLTATNKRWLVVLDDLSDPADLKGLWPQGAKGRVLVTTRRRDAALADRGTMLDVDLFTEDEAADYLTGRLSPEGLHPDRLVEVGKLSEDLGRLPLALAQAAAYILDRDLTCATYRRRLTQRRLELALPPDAPAGDYAATMATTWSLSIELADRLPPAGLARPLLTLAAFLDSHGIPSGLFATEAVRTFLTAPEEEAAVSPAATSSEERLKEDVEDSLSNLHRLNLITRLNGGDGGRAGAVRVHALVQRATREQAGLAADKAARAAAEALLQTWPNEDYRPEHASLAQSLRDSTDALAATAAALLWDAHVHPVLFRAGRSRMDGGLINQALAYWAVMTTTAEQTLGPDHPNTLTSRNNLASAYHRAGRLAEAMPLLKRTLTDCERIVGPDRPLTLTSRNNLAFAYKDAGRLIEAVPLFERTLTDCERMLGPDHLNTLASRSNLAFAYKDAGRLIEAVPLFERTLTDRERIQGPDHPDTLASRNNLALAYHHAGRKTEAVTLLERTLADCERILGPDHPDTLASRNNVVLAYHHADRKTEAVTLLERTLADCERILGPDHPLTLKTRNNLARAYHHADRKTEAVTLLERTLADCERILGPDHPLTLKTRNNLAFAY